MLSKKERLQIAPVKMREQRPEQRIHNQNEVPLGYSPQEAILEAERCLQCKNAPCINGCPVEVDIPGFIGEIARGNFSAAFFKVSEKNVLPAICGRVCPQEEQCQAECTVTKVLKSAERSVNIGKLERFVADYAREKGMRPRVAHQAKSGKKVAVIGSGPAGLTVAGDLARLGHEVTLFEALHVVGGVLVYGIPEFRLPKSIVEYEIDALQQSGVGLKCNYVIGKIKSIKEMLREFDSVFIGTGAGLPRFMEIPGENLIGVYSANEYLTRANLMHAFDFPRSDTPILSGDTVAVVGGGNVAMDAARTALRAGAKKVTLVYRRSEKEMPARLEEIEHARQEGVRFQFLVNPVRILADQNEWVSGMELVRMKLGEPDSTGRRRPVVVPGSEFTMKTDLVIMAIGNSPNPLLLHETPELSINEWGGIIADPETGATSIAGVFAGGDIVLGAATVILAMGQGRRAAQSMHTYMMHSNGKKV